MKTKAPKKEVLSLRIEPKLRYLIDLASRIQRRNLTNYVEWALEESLKSVTLECHDGVTKDMSVYEAGNIPNFIWSTDEAHNFFILATTYKELLTYEEQRILEIIQSLPYLFRLNPNKPFSYENGNNSNVAKYWELILKAHKDGAPTQKSPSYNELLDMDQAEKKAKEEMISFIDELKARLYSERGLEKVMEHLSIEDEISILNVARKIMSRRLGLESEPSIKQEE